VGKTSVATGVMAALARRGVRVAAAKVGPDFIDPGYHALATGRPGRNLDAWISGAAAVGPLAARAGAGADVLVVEGVMGLFDGAGEPVPGAGSDPRDDASTAHVARLLEAPVVLVVDAAAMSGSVAALVHGFATFDRRVRVGGVILNRVGSPGHEAMLRAALEPTGIPVLGAIPRNPAFAWRDRHLGLVPVVERPAETAAALVRLADAVAGSVDLDAIVRLARSAPPRPTPDPAQPDPVPGPARVVVAVAAGAAFSFYYPDNLEALAAAGAELVPFDPTTDPTLPPGTTALYAGGGFPEVHAPALAANRPLLAEVRRRVRAGLVTWAECGGLLWLARSLDGHDLCGALDTRAAMTDRLTLGYRRAVLRRSTPLGPAGCELRGHEFHYSAIDPPGDALEMSGRAGRARGGFASRHLLASYLHLHLGADPRPARNFVATAAAAAAAAR
jgi:cobyrinic acid a,c-diamide synthase